jgi:hypothetical protein
MRALTAAGLEMAAIVVCRELPAALPERVYGVRAASVAEDLQRLPDRL